MQVILKIQLYEINRMNPDNFDDPKLLIQHHQQAKIVCKTDISFCQPQAFFDINANMLTHANINMQQVRSDRDVLHRHKMRSPFSNGTDAQH